LQALDGHRAHDVAVYFSAASYCASRASDICSDFSSGLQDFFEIPQSKSAQQLLHESRHRVRVH
ncbi:hypothetical protein E4U50_002305, partial [Claviceps purpurea]